MNYILIVATILNLYGPQNPDDSLKSDSHKPHGENGHNGKITHEEYVKGFYDD